MPISSTSIKDTNLTRKKKKTDNTESIKGIKFVVKKHKETAQRTLGPAGFTGEFYWKNTNSTQNKKENWKEGNTYHFILWDQTEILIEKYKPISIMNKEVTVLNLFFLATWIQQGTKKIIHRSKTKLKRNF